MNSPEVQQLFSGVTCYSRLGLSSTQLLTLALERQWLLSLNPAADTSVEGLISAGKCFAAFGLSTFDLLELSLLSSIEGEM